MPEKKTHGIIVPVPELSREVRSALAFASAGGAVPVGGPPVVKVDPSDVDPVNTAVARTLLLEVAGKAIKRAIEGATSSYREAMREKYATEAIYADDAEALVEPEGFSEPPAKELDEAATKRGIFRR